MFFLDAFWNTPGLIWKFCYWILEQHLLKSFQTYQKMICPYNPLTGKIISSEPEIVASIHPTEVIKGEFQDYYYCEIKDLYGEKINRFEDYRALNIEKNRNQFC